MLTTSRSLLAKQKIKPNLNLKALKFKIEGVNNLIINRVLGGGDTLDFDQIFFEGQPRCDHKGVRWFVVPKYLFSDIAHGLQVFPVRYICSHLNKIC